MMTSEHMGMILIHILYKIQKRFFVFLDSMIRYLNTNINKNNKVEWL